MSKTGPPPVMLLCGGLGGHIADRSGAMLTPFLSVRDRPTVIEIMRHFAVYGISEFVLALAAPGRAEAKDYFLHYQSHSTSFTVRLSRDAIVQILDNIPEEGWAVTCVDTGDTAGTGTQIRDAMSFVPRWPTIVAHCGGLADLNAAELMTFHRAHGRMATVVVAPPPARFSHVTLAENRRVLQVGGEPHNPPGLVSTGIFVLELAAVEHYIPPDKDVALEADPVQQMIADGELMAYPHSGYWHPADTPRDPTAMRLAWDSRTPQRVRTAHHNGNGRLAALTRRELEVATLVSEGLTNRAIARRLSVTEKTIEMHLSKAFGKLAVLSRTELTALVIRARYG